MNKSLQHRKIIIMLHYFSDYSYQDWDYTPALDRESDRAICSLTEDGMLVENTTPDPEIRKPQYSITARGTAYVEFLLSVPLPAETWVIEMDGDV